MLQKEKSSEWDGSAERVNRLIVLAERELSAFFAAVNKDFGTEQASKSGLADERRHSELAPGNIGRKSAAKWVESKKARPRLRNPNSDVCGRAREDRQRLDMHFFKPVSLLQVRNPEVNPSARSHELGFPTQCH